jgi:hypothetical protein
MFIFTPDGPRLLPPSFFFQVTDSRCLFLPCRLITRFLSEASNHSYYIYPFLGSSEHGIGPIREAKVTRADTSHLPTTGDSSVAIFKVQIQASATFCQCAQTAIDPLSMIYNHTTAMVHLNVYTSQFLENSPCSCIQVFGL